MIVTLYLSDVLEIFFYVKIRLLFLIFFMHKILLLVFSFKVKYVFLYRTFRFLSLKKKRSTPLSQCSFFTSV